MLHHCMRFGRVLFLLCAVVLSCLPVSAYAQTAEETPLRRNILCINSYHHGYTWSDNILRGIRETLKASRYNIDLQVEYMDTKKYGYEPISTILNALYRDKFRYKTFDAIIVSDDNAFRFIREWRNVHFPNVPVVFCGVNGIEPGEEIEKGITGVLEEFNVQANIELAMKLHPGKRRVVVIGDESVTGVAIRNQVKRGVERLDQNVSFEYWTRQGLREIVDRVRRQPQDTFFYFIPFYKDFEGQSFSAEDVLREVSRNAKVPVYSNWQFLLGSGIVGGSLISGYAHGEAAANIALRILDGEDTEDIPISVLNQQPMRFDYEVLQRFYITEDQLPKPYTLINAPKAFYELDKEIFWTIIVSLLLLASVLAVLFRSFIRLRIAETALKDQLSFMQVLINTIPIPIFFRDRFGLFEGCNTAFEQWFGTSREELVGLADRDIGGMPVASVSDRVDAKLIQSPGVRIYEARIPSADGRLNDVIMHKAAHLNIKGDTAGIVGVVFDITDRKRAENELRESRKMLALVLDNIPQLVTWKDRSLRYIGANRSFARFYGFGEDQTLSGLTDRDLMPNREDAERMAHLDRQVIGLNEPVHRMKVKVTDSDGEDVWFEMSKVPLYGDDGQVVGVLTATEDVTRKVQLERQLLQSQKMEAIGTLAGGIAHDFNNILTSIMNSTELALEDIEADTMTRKDLERALKAADRGSKLVKQILAFSRPSQEGFMPTDIAEVLREALVLIKASMPRNIEVLKDIPEGQAMTQADPTQIHQIIMNLCTNSFQSLRATGGTLKVSLGYEMLDDKKGQLINVQAGPYLRVVVEDNGPGISQDIIDKVFDPFFTTKDKTEGTGLGLAVVHGIIKGHGGGISLESIPGEKTAFSVFLPCLSDVCAFTAKGELQDFRGEERVLFVEDDEDQLEVIPRALGGLGYRVAACQGADEALAVLRAEPDSVDIVITDFDMPKTNGLELANGVLEIAPDLPVILVSGRGRTAELAAEGAPNIKKMIRKPYNRTTIAEAIRAIMVRNGKA